MLIDSNLLIYALNSSSPKHRQAQAFLQAHQENLVFAHQNIFETLRILTHPKFPTPFSVEKAIKAVQKITDQANIIYPTSETPAIAFELLKKYRVKGSEIFDAYLIATALSHGLSEVVSDNTKHLKKYQEIAITNPFGHQELD